MRIMIAVDLTDEDADDFVGRAAKWAEALGATADLVFIDEAQDEHPYIMDANLRATMSEHYEAWHREQRDRLGRQLHVLPSHVRGEARVIRGRAAHELLQLADSYDAIVLGNRPVSGLARLAHGAIAERVARQAHTPVVILPRG